MNRNELTIGQTVYLESHGRRGDKEIKQGAVTKIGRKYITVKMDYQDIQINIDDGREKDTGYGYGYNWVMHLSEQAIADQKEYRRLKQLMNTALRTFNRAEFTLEQLRQAVKILELECAEND